MDLSWLELELRQPRIVNARSIRLGHGTVVIVLAVNQVIVGPGCVDVEIGTVASGIFHDFKVITVMIVAKHDGSDVDIIRNMLWAVDNEWTECPGCPLGGIVRVPPRGSVFACAESVGK